MNNQNNPEIITINDENFGSHVEHWNLLTDEPASAVPKWLGLALDAPVMPMGICKNEAEMDQNTWLIQGPQDSEIQFSQIIDVENNKPKAVKIAFPCFNSPYKYEAKIERIITCKSNAQAVLRLNLGHNTIVYAFDSFYSVNQARYQKDQTYFVRLNAFAYELRAVSDHEQLIVDDPASIKHHRALNAILAANNGVAPSNLQDQIDAWQPQTEDDEAPVTVDFSKMVAYLYGEKIGQEDEAWFQGKVVGKLTFDFMNQRYTHYDVTLFLEENQPAVLARITTKNSEHQDFSIGQYIRGNIWLQTSIY
ncbi:MULTISPECIES: hypothetical protein [unclassified Acinetobacter]|uniref:hypothetical protein n=1 Tax=unclassified Acinetobacter TaxID=196816 RepID=UPI002934FE4B|nr:MULTISPECIES: hypothetical protein [unclassified Acinetobacter]WOE31560.1 hypothetical protein QSG84_14840 [Acinetobacter sp. SAAs470]WOE39757.1 hypothetical protein QSG86_08505 [Acinetobacter sp. SAAs474]